VGMLKLAEDIGATLRSKGDGFHYKCANGNTVSVQWRPGCYCTARAPTFEERLAGKRMRDCENAEVAIWDSAGVWHSFGVDTVIGWQTPAEVRAWIAWAEANEVTPKRTYLED